MSFIMSEQLLDMNSSPCASAAGEGMPGNAWRTTVTALYDAEAAKLILYGRALGLGHSEAEDVLQDVFMALLALTTVPDEPAHYAVRAYRNRALNFRRSWWRRSARELESTRWFEPAEPGLPREEAALRCLARLPAEQRETIVLKLWHGHTFEAIAELQGISPNTAAGRYRYGLAKLRTCLNHPKTEGLDENASPTRSGYDGQELGFLDTASPFRSHP